MELSFKELKKRDVINIADGKCLGRVTDLRLCFPEGILTGISVPGKKSIGLFSFLNKSEMFIGVEKILKIGGDVILVDLRKGVKADKPCIPPPKKPTPPPCPPPHPPHGRDEREFGGGISQGEFINSFGQRMDESDY